MSNIPLVDSFFAFLNGRLSTESLFLEFVNANLTAANVDAAGSQVTLLYSGKYDGAQSYLMAQRAATDSGGKIGIIDNTKIGKFLNYILFDDVGSSQLNFSPSKEFVAGIFDAASAKFVSEAQGNIVTMTSTSILDSTWNRAEVDAIMGNSKITHVNGVDLAPFRAQWNKLNSDSARHAYAKIFFERTFAQAVSEGTGNAVFADGASAVMQLDSATKQKLGLPLFDSNTNGLTQILDNEALQNKLFTAYARGLAGEAQMQSLLDTPEKAVASMGVDAASASAEFQGETTKIVAILKKMRDLGKLSGLSDFVGLMRAYLGTAGADITLAVDVIQQHAGLIKQALKDAPSAIKDAALKYLKVFESFWSAEEGLVIPEIEAASAFRIAGVRLR
jgi:hypothetical protein